MHKVLCSTGALLKYGGDYKVLEILSKKLQCDGYEFMVDSPYYEEVESLKRFLRKIKLCIPAVHCEKSIGEKISIGSRAELDDAYDKFEINCDMAKDIGAEKIVIHLWGGRTSDSKFQNNLEGYAVLNEVAGKYGLELLVENVVCNVENPMKHLCELREWYPGIQFTFDTKMAAFHGQLELLYEEQYEWMWKEGHICHYHVNDYVGGYMDWKNLRSLPIGKGKIDFARFFEFVSKTGYDGDFTVEATGHDIEGNVDIEMLNGQFKRIREYVGETSVFMHKRVQGKKA